VGGRRARQRRRDAAIGRGRGDGAKGECMIEIDEDHLPRERIKLFLYADGFCSVDNGLMMSAFGGGALQTIARKMLALGYDPEQELDVHRGGESVQRILLRDAVLDSGDDY